MYFRGIGGRSRGIKVAVSPEGTFKKQSVVRIINFVVLDFCEVLFCSIGAIFCGKG